MFKPMAWLDFVQVLVQASAGSLFTYGVGLLVLDLSRRWSVHRQIENEISERGVRDWVAGLRAEIDKTKKHLPDPVVLPPETTGPPSGGYDTRCPDCAHILGVHDENGRCTEVQCLALGSDQICPNVIQLLLRLDHRMKLPNWSTHAAWSMFCRLCGHRMAHHAADSAGRHECPPGQNGPFHDGPTTSRLAVDYRTPLE